MTFDELATKPEGKPQDVLTRYPPQKSCYILNKAITEARYLVVYLPNIDVEVKGGTGWSAVEGGGEGEEERGRLVQLGQVGWVLDR